MDNDNQLKFKLPPISIISYIFSVVWVVLGMYKMWVYSNPEYSWEGNLINAYVGGDAYNYIINSNYAGAFFTLALIFVVVGSTFAIIKVLTLPNDNTSQDNYEDLPDL